MLQADIVELERRRKILEEAIAEALAYVASNDLMITDLRSRVLFVRQQIEILRDEANAWSYDYRFSFCSLERGLGEHPVNQ
jgi:hypothetical protein